MINIELPDDIGNRLTSLLPKWKEMDERIGKSHLQKDLILNIAHQTTKHKLESAMFHLDVMVHAYTVKYSSNVIPEFLIRSTVASIFLDLSSALDALAHEINRVYLFGLEYKYVQMDHQSYNKHEECVRCRLDKLNDGLSTFLNSEIPRITKDRRQEYKDHWYFVFSEYRNQIVHRTLYVLGYTHAGLFLPDDPSNLDPRITRFYNHETGEALTEPDYRHKRGPLKYCQECLGRLILVTESAYAELLTRL